VVGTLALASFLARPAPAPSTRPDDGGPELTSGERAAGEAAPWATAEAVAQEKRTRRDRAVEWLQANNRWGPDHPLVTDTAARIDKDLAGSEAFQVLLAPP
jgi:hypothetical protein